MIVKRAISSLFRELCVKKRTPYGDICLSTKKTLKESFKWWAILDSNQRPPQCQCDALPTAPTRLSRRRVSRALRIRILERVEPV